jgi:YD repeat-containing protein
MYVYDAMDRRIREDVRHFDTQTQLPILDGQSTTIRVFGPSSALRSRSDDVAAHVTAYEYDTASRLSRSTDAKGNTITTTYDRNGNAITVVESELSDLGGPAQLFTTTDTYDALDRLLTETDNVGNLVRFAHDSRGNLVLDTDPLGQRTRYVYDGLDRLTETRRDMNGNGGFNDVIDIILRETWTTRRARRARPTTATRRRSTPTTRSTAGS